MVVQLLEDGATHVGVATDHIIESFRNTALAGIQNRRGHRTALRAQFTRSKKHSSRWASLSGRWSNLKPTMLWHPPLISRRRTIELRRFASGRRTKILPNAWLTIAWCKLIAAAERFVGRKPVARSLVSRRSLFADYLALVGDSADGYPGFPGCGAKTAARLINRYGPLENFPPALSEENRELALLFKDLATLRTDAPLFKDVDELRMAWGDAGVRRVAEKIENARLLKRVTKTRKAI